MDFATKAVHEGYTPDATGAVMPPIYMTSTYQLDAPGITKEGGYDYTRAGNPNFTILEKVMASLEEAKFATVFSSGLGALTGMLSMLSKGDKVVAINGLYGGTYRLFTQVFVHYGIELILIAADKLDTLEKQLSQPNVKWLLFETPTNPLLGVFDIQECAKIAKRHGILTVIDNTFATPFFQNPLKLGADIVWHSSTKYLGGHSDIIGGVAMTNDAEIAKKLLFSRKAMGLNPSPFDAWLVTRGIKTLALRMKKHQENALKIAQFFEKHPAVKKVYYPGLPSHSTHEIAKKQMSGYSGMVSVEFNLESDKIKALISSLKLFALAESLGGVESLVCHPATMTHATIPVAEREEMGITNGLVRFSIGIEDAQDLIDDVNVALKKL
jgi:cystathionine beta-lyase/cystathionine gamma-synthase